MADPVQLLGDGPREIQLTELFAEIGRLSFMNNLLTQENAQLKGLLNAERIERAVERGDVKEA